MAEFRHKKMSEKIVNAIWEEIYGRCGGDHFLDAYGDEAISQDIYDSLVDVVDKAIIDKVVTTMGPKKGKKK